MWHGFVGQQISASTKALRTTGTILLGLSLILSIPGSKSLLNVLQGPVEFTEAKLQSFTSGTNGFRNYVRVSGRNTTPTGIVEIRTNTRGEVAESREEVGEYMVMAVGDHFLLVKPQPNDTRDRYVGGLKELPSNLQKEFFSKTSDRELKSATLPLLLDATGAYYEDLLWFAPVLIVMGLGIWFLRKSSKQRDAPETHPFCKALSAYGSCSRWCPRLIARFLLGLGHAGALHSHRNGLFDAG